MKATNYALGESLDYTPGSDVTGGVPFKLAGLCAVPQADIDSGVQDGVQIRGIVKVEKVQIAFVAGDIIHYDSNGSPYGGTALSGAATKEANDGDLIMGVCVAAAAATATHCLVLLNQLHLDLLLTGEAENVVGGVGDITALDLVYGSDQAAGVVTVLPAQGTTGGNFAEYICPKAITAAETGLAVTEYLLQGVDTSAAGAVNDPVYLSDTAAGGYTFIKPTLTDKVQIVGRVVEDHATTGAILFQLPGVIQITHTHASNAEGGTIGQVLDSNQAANIADAGAGLPILIQKTFPDAATGDVQVFNANCPVKLRIIDAWVENRATNGANANSVQVCKSASGADTISDAISLNNVADNTLVRASTIDDANAEIAASGSLYLRVTKAGGTVGGNVYMLAIPIA